MALQIQSWGLMFEAVETTPQVIFLPRSAKGVCRIPWDTSSLGLVVQHWNRGTLFLFGK